MPDVDITQAKDRTRDIGADPRTVRQLLKGVKYTIDYYQREYKWQDKQMRELVDDLTTKFIDEYDPKHDRTEVAQYPPYFLGSIIISQRGGNKYIVDGQQRLTSLTLLLFYLRNLQARLAPPKPVNVDELISSESFGQMSFNLDVDERATCMQALYEDQPFDPNGSSESVRNIVLRYRDIESAFPSEADLPGIALPYFIDWLLERVYLVEIRAYSDEDAYTIFETMNDRGLSLSPTEMLKGFLLANITDGHERSDANTHWRQRTQGLSDKGREVEADFFKNWLRSQYANDIRERRKGAKPEDFDRIGTEFHRWLRDNDEAIGLSASHDYIRFIRRDFDFYSRQYLTIVKASREAIPGLERVLYNAHHGFTLQNMLLLAPLRPDDSPDIIRTKLRLVAHFVDIRLAWRLWNFHSIAYSTMQYAMFLVMRDIRGLDPVTLAHRLVERLRNEPETFATNDRLYMHQQNRWYLHRILARITDYVGIESGEESSYVKYVSDAIKDRFEVEHIWADKFEEHTDEFSHRSDFGEHRNRIGGLLLLPKSFNASYGAHPFEKKVEKYPHHNILAWSLHNSCYENHPGFKKFVARSGLPFRPYEHFKKSNFDERSHLYRLIAEQIWNPDDLLREVGE